MHKGCNENFYSPSAKHKRFKNSLQPSGEVSKSHVMPDSEPGKVIVLLLYNGEISESVSPSPNFEPNQNGHNSVTFEARTSGFWMVVNMEEEVEEEDDDNNFFSEANQKLLSS